MKLYKISKVAIKLGISKQTLLRYEKKGILPKSRRNHINSWREYTDEDVKKMKEILRRGFTLIEVAMVVVIISILVVLAVPRFESFYSIKLSGAVKKAVSDIRYVQQMSIARHANSTITYNQLNDFYFAQEQLPDGSWQNMKDPFTMADLNVTYGSDPQYTGIDISNVNFNGNQHISPVRDLVVTYI